MQKTTPRSNDIYLITCILLLIGFPFFFWGGPGYHSPRSFKAVWDLGHIFYFLLLTRLLHGLLWKKFGTDVALRFVLVLFLALTALGALVEVLQMLCDGRSPDFYDVLRDQLGCLLALAWYVHPVPFSQPWERYIFRVFTCGLLIVAVQPLSVALVDEYRAIQQFPLLADFETSLERFRWEESKQLRVVTEPVRHGKNAVRLEFAVAKKSEISMFNFARDWRGYETLHFSVYNPYADGLILQGRINDLHHKQHGYEDNDRFCDQYSLRQGWNDLVISLDQVLHAPSGRLMDMEHIERFSLVMLQVAQPMELYLDYIYLDK